MANRYRLVDVLGEGGMACVYLGVDRERCRPVAVKLIRREAFASSVAHTRFHREARAIAKLRHPGFLRLIDWGIERGAPFMVMEMGQGETLGSILRRHQRLNTEVAVRIAIAVCERLEHVHACGLVHRDVKPSNILVASIENADIRLIDFGIAKAEASCDLGLTRPMALTQQGVLLGSPPYTSPEQLRGAAVDARADIYAVGMLLYRMVTGDVPFHARHALATACMQLAGRPAPPTVLAPFLPDALTETIMSCIETEPDGRPATATALRSRLLEIASDLEAPTPTPMSSAWVSPAVLAAALVLAVGAASAMLLG